jgi:hypothetical protein
MVLFSGHGARKPHDRASTKLGVGSEPLSSNLQGPSRRPYILGLRSTLPLQLERKVEEKIQSILSEPPVFVKVMTTSNVVVTGKSPCYMVRLHILFSTSANIKLDLLFVVLCLFCTEILKPASVLYFWSIHLPLI